MIWHFIISSVCVCVCREWRLDKFGSHFDSIHCLTECRLQFVVCEIHNQSRRNESRESLKRFFTSSISILNAFRLWPLTRRRLVSHYNTMLSPVFQCAPSAFGQIQSNSLSFLSEWKAQQTHCMRLPVGERRVVYLAESEPTTIIEAAIISLFCSQPDTHTRHTDK